MAANKKREANDYYQLIVAWVKGYGINKPFTAKQISDDLVVENNLVTVFLRRKTKKGYFKKISLGQFVVVNPNIPLQLSKGKLPDLVFSLLKELNTKYPKGYVRELYIKEKLADQKITLNSVHSIMQRWCEQGIVVRNKMGKGFRLKDEYLLSDNRPLVHKTK